MYYDLKLACQLHISSLLVDINFDKNKFRANTSFRRLLYDVLHPLRAPIEMSLYTFYKKVNIYADFLPNIRHDNTFSYYPYTPPNSFFFFNKLLLTP